MNAAKKEKKFQRTTKTQLECYIAFLKQHPELQSGKNTPVNPRQIGEMWEEVAGRLNSLEGAIRTPHKWKESLANWKKQLRCRTRKTKAERALTGGGPAPTDVDEFELQALETIGMAAVDGIPAATLGFETIDFGVECEPDLYISPLEPLVASPAWQRTFASTANVSNIVFSPPRTSRSARDENSPPKKVRKGSKEVIAAVLEQMKKREQQEKKTAEILSKLSEVFVGLTKVLRSLSNK